MVPGPYFALRWLAALAAEVTAVTVDRLVNAASIEANKSLSAQVGSTKTQQRRGNAARNTKRMIKRLRLTWEVPLSHFLFEAESTVVDVPYISPLNLFKYFLDTHPELLFGGMRDVRDQVSMIEGWWDVYRQRHPGHQAFTVHEGGLGYLIPLYVYGDEGKGKRRGNTAIFTCETPLGLHTVLNQREGSHCSALNCSCQSQCSETTCNFFGGNQFPHTRPAIGYAATNMKESSMLSKFLLWVIPCEIYKKHPSLISAVLEKLAEEFRQLFYEGIRDMNGRLWCFALAGMKGDMKWHKAVAGLTRFFGTKGRKNSRLMCPLCLAGSNECPYEDVSQQPSWLATLHASRPWDSEPPMARVPFDTNQPERFYRPDLFHNVKLGIFRHYAGAVLTTLIRWDYFKEVPVPPEGNSADIQLQRSYGHFHLWCATFNHTPALRSFSRRLFNWPNYRAYAWANVKASDASLLVQWLVTLLEQILQGPLHVPSHKPMFRAMIQVGHAGLDLFSALYSHNLALARPCAMFAYERTTIMLNGYCVLAARSLHHWQLCAWSLVPKVHMVRHMSLELQLQLQAGASYVLSPLATACDMNEDMVGRMCKLYVAVESREMMQQILQLYLVKARILQRRTAKRLHI